jgi:hypothetical protein
MLKAKKTLIFALLAKISVYLRTNLIPAKLYYLRFRVLLVLFLYRHTSDLKGDLVAGLIHIHVDNGTVFEFAAKQFHRKRTLDILLNGAA